jgi:hypothetical protein
MATQVFLDTFTAANGTDITSRTPDSGAPAAWTEVEDPLNEATGATVTTNSARPPATLTFSNNRYLMQATPTTALGSADYTVEATIASLPGTGAGAVDDLTFIFGRRTDNSNYYFAGYYQGTANTINLWKRVAGTASLLGSAAYSPVVNDNIRLSMIGSTIKVQVNDVDLVSVTDGSLGSTGAGGMGWGNAATSASDDINSSARWDNFIIMDHTSAGGTNVSIFLHNLRQQGIS